MKTGKMAFNPKLVDVSVVVVASNHNPRLLNADFLRNNDIVPSDWKDSDVLVTQPFAQTIFENNVIIQLGVDKLIIQAKADDKINWRDKLPEMAIQFMATLPHVDYRAAGMNFTFIAESPTRATVERSLIDNMMKPGTWTSELGGLSGIAIELQFKKREPYISFKLGALPQQADLDDKLQSKAFLIQVNVHSDFSKEQKADRVNFLRTLGKTYDDVSAALSKLPLAV